MAAFCAGVWVAALGGGATGAAVIDARGAATGGGGAIGVGAGLTVTGAGVGAGSAAVAVGLASGATVTVAVGAGLTAAVCDAGAAGGLVGFCGATVGLAVGGVALGFVADVGAGACGTAATVGSRESRGTVAVAPGGGGGNWPITGAASIGGSDGICGVTTGRGKATSGGGSSRSTFGWLPPRSCNRS
ncbi:hypothetical protein [Azospirillum cavernae]|uniref:hypothetical protein n=1 Tax=Azospirillum cavernae TaxID=2320860 RepID=UPI001EE4F788|nr:hypothetical protein [Azospirillum cavernae]